MSVPALMVPATLTGNDDRVCGCRRVLLGSASALSPARLAPTNTALTAAVALTMPLPQPTAQALGKARAVVFSSTSTSSGVKVGLRASISAATPATCGAAIEVPW